MLPIEKIRLEQERIKRHGTAIEKIRRKKQIKKWIRDSIEYVRNLYVYMVWILWLECLVALPPLLVMALWKYLGE